jgi:drug/metabolite transporter (DMT)-like permease
MSRTLRGDLLLLLIAFFWGISYYLSDLCLTELGPFGLNAWRFLCAFGISFALLYRKIGLPNRKTLKYAALLGAILAAVYALANFCLLYTSLSNAGFLCSLATVTTPILALLFQRKRPGIKLGVVILMSLVGVALLSLTEEFTIRVGDVFGIICSFFAGGHILLTESAVAYGDLNPSPKKARFPRLLRSRPRRTTSTPSSCGLANTKIMPFYGRRVCGFRNCFVAQPNDTGVPVVRRRHLAKPRSNSEVHRPTGSSLRRLSDKDVKPVQVGVWNLLFTGLIMFAFSAVLEHPAGGVIAVPRSVGVWLSLAFLTVFCTALSFVLQPVAQQWTEASRVGVIYTLEPVFAGLVAVVIAGDVLLPRAYVGAALMIISMLVMEIDFGRMLERRRVKKPRL